MKRHWIVRQQFTPYPDGAQRWDRAYQHLLQWANAPIPLTPTPPPLSSQPPQEVDHASSSLCSGLDPAPSREPND